MSSTVRGESDSSTAGRPAHGPDKLLTGKVLGGPGDGPWLVLHAVQLHRRLQEVVGAHLVRLRREVVAVRPSKAGEELKLAG